MCGIVGYTGSKRAVDVILGGLARLEYRGYDSSGIAVCCDGALCMEKRQGKLARLRDSIDNEVFSGSTGLGHTRWATHGVPSDENAHPHLDGLDEIAVVHNGIIENYQALRDLLRPDGIVFRSETDSEVLAHLIRKYYDGDLFDAVKRALKLVEGAYAICVVCKDEPSILVCARKGSPLVIGVGDGEMFVASDVPALLEHTRRVVYLEDGMVCRLTRDEFHVEDLEGEVQKPELSEIDWDVDVAEKEGFPHFMLKEIYEQPEALRRVMRGRLDETSNTVDLTELSVLAQDFRDCSGLFLVACGTAWHAALLGKLIIESIAKIRVEVDVASEFRYRNPIIPAGSIVIPVSQSGETADTLEAIRLARESNAKVLSVVNVVGSSIARYSDAVLYTHAGPEIGVASTKAYTTQITALVLLAIHLGKLRGTVEREQEQTLCKTLLGLPDKIQHCLDHADEVESCAKRFKYVVAHSALFMGRTFNYPTAMEGALKLKEISYIHAEGYAAGEMKHGPIALVTDLVPAICIALQGAVYEKMISNIQEISARRGVVLAIATEGDEAIREHCDDVFYVPECYEPFSPIVAVVPIQLFAYYVAVNRGCDVDQPRNLAKSVTVE